MAVRICPRICFCGESISKNAFRPFESGYRPENSTEDKPSVQKCINKILKNFRNEKSTLVNQGAGEISRNLRFSALRHAAGLFSCPHLNQTRIMCRVSDLGAKPCVANLDVRRFCRGDTNPLAMMGVALTAIFRDATPCLQTRSM